MKCECPNEGVIGCPEWFYHPTKELPFVNHKPGQCKCTNELRMYRRDGKLLTLCSVCFFPSDVPVSAN